ncbi:MAG: hypothetical protein AB2629_17060, partial [Candidatus Thiodiazotropha sp.]
VRPDTLLSLNTPVAVVGVELPPPPPPPPQAASKKIEKSDISLVEYMVVLNDMTILLICSMSPLDKDLDAIPS